MSLAFASALRAHVRSSWRQAAAASLLVAAAGPASGAELKVTVTIKPIHALVAQVMEGVGKPGLLVQGAGSPHTYALKPSDAVELNASTVFFRVSGSVEPFTRKIVSALPASVRVVTLAEAPGIVLLDVRTGATFEAHDHHEHALGEVHDDAHDDADEAEHEHAGTKDGHVWLDPANARHMLDEIARVLADADPADAGKFKANAARSKAALDALEQSLARDLAPLKGRPYVVFHDAYQYFERRFGLAAVGSITVNPETQPSAKRLAEIRSKLLTLRAACVFSEPLFQPRLVAAVTEGTDARAGTLDPEGISVEPGPAAYETLLRNLASGLRSCLSHGS
jgi:zinc transport system substrate-binding protein